MTLPPFPHMPFPAPLMPAPPPWPERALPIGSICMYAGHVAQVAANANPAWDCCKKDTTTTTENDMSANNALAPDAAADSDPVALLEAQGWMVCDGRKLEVSRFPRLYAVLGSLYGPAAKGTFKLPDYRGAFLRGVDNGAGVDPDTGERRKPNGDPGYAGVGSMQCDAFQLHQHHYTGVLDKATAQPGSPATIVNPKPVETVEPVSGRHSSETRPRNIAVYFIIKAR